MLDSDEINYNKMLSEAAQTLQIHSMFFPSVGFGMYLNATTAQRFAKDLERLIDENNGNGS